MKDILLQIEQLEDEVAVWQERGNATLARKFKEQLIALRKQVLKGKA